MSELVLTNHATVRMAQRGFKLSDAELITLLGSEVEGGYFVKNKDCIEIEKILRGLLEQIRRIRGKRLVIDKNVVITAYFPTYSKKCQLLRTASEVSS
jgi:hypothetical protein